MLAPLAGAVAAKGVREVEGAGRPVRLLELAHAVGHLREEVRRHRKMIDAEVEFADDVVNRFGSGFRRSHVPEGKVEAGVSGAGRAVGEGDQAVDDLDDGVEVFQRQRQAGVAEFAVAEVQNSFVGERLGIGGAVGEGGVDGAVAAELPDLGGGVGTEGGQALDQVRPHGPWSASTVAVTSQVARCSTAPRRTGPATSLIPVPETVTVPGGSSTEVRFTSLISTSGAPAAAPSSTTSVPWSTTMVGKAPWGRGGRASRSGCSGRRGR